MAKIGSPDVGFILIGGYDLLGVSVTAFKMMHEAVTEEETGSGDADENHAKVGLSRGSLELSGFYEDAAGKSDAALIAFGDRVVLIAHRGNTIGKLAWGFAGAVEAVYNRVLAVAALHKANANFKMNGPIEVRHVILHTHSTESAASGDTEGTSVDNSASSADGGAGIVGCEDLNLGGYTDVTVKVRDSTDNVVWADLVTFTNISAAKTATRKTVAGTVDRYLSMSWLFNGSGSGQSIKFAVSFHRS